jgi:hypothetical protein
MGIVREAAMQDSAQRKVVQFIEAPAFTGIEKII